jgi:hypothetical protein
MVVGVLNLADMIGHYLLVKVTYVHPDGHDEHVEFVGPVTAVKPLVAVTQPGNQEPFTLPPDPKFYKPIDPGPFSTGLQGESSFNPRFKTAWRVKVPSSKAGGPAPEAFHPRGAKP